MDIELYSVWRPITSHTGIGIVLLIQDIPESRIDMYKNDEDFDGKLYHFITDFGNICILTKSELINNYDYIYTDSFPEERLKRQVELLKEVERLYFIEVEG